MDWRERIRREIFEKSRPTLLLGSGSSISTGISLNLRPNFPSMNDLTKRFCDSIETDGFSTDEIIVYNMLQKEYDGICKKEGQFNLESFLADHPLRRDSKFIQQILEHTAEAFKEPHKALTKILEQEPSHLYPVRKMLESLIKSLPAAYPELHVITPNYDLLVEYSADLIRTPCLTGFCGGIIRHWNPEIGFNQPSINRNGKPYLMRRLRLIKPHGSFAWYQSKTDPEVIIENFALRELNGEWQRHMIVPGPTKYEGALKNVCRDHMRYMDQAFVKARSLLVIGYGFNDSHLEEGLKRGLSRGIPTIYVTKELSDTAIESFVVPYHNVTCITSDGLDGSLVYCGDTQIDCPGENLWMLDRFVKEFIG
jgi:hypothetical protein